MAELSETDCPPVNVSCACRQYEGPINRQLTQKETIEA
jgi:hypothetical protein